MIMQKFYIWWLGVSEVEEYVGSFQDAIRYVKYDRRSFDYGRTGAKIIEGEIIYSLEKENVERFL